MGASDTLPEGEGLGSSAVHGDCPADSRLAVLWALARARDEAATGAVTAKTVADIVTVAGRHSITRQAALSTLNALAAEKAVHRTKRRKGPDEFSIMALGEQMLGASKPVVLVDPAKALQETRDLETVLSEIKGAVKICDPYLDSRTLDFIAAMSNASSVKLLTEKVTDAPKIGRELPAAAKQIGAQIEVRVAARGVLHDRYIIHDGGMLVLGTSLNSFGLKQSFVSKVGHDVRTATASFFDDRWKSAPPL